MIDKYQQLCEYIMELNEDNQVKLNKARVRHDVYGHDFFDLLAVEDVIHQIKTKIGEIERGNE